LNEQIVGKRLRPISIADYEGVCPQMSRIDPFLYPVQQYFAPRVILFYNEILNTGLN